MKYLKIKLGKQFHSQQSSKILVQRASLVAQIIKNWLARQETRVQSPGWEDPLEKGMATHSSIPAWEISWTEKSVGLYSPWSHKESDTILRLNHHHKVKMKW